MVETMYYDIMSAPSGKQLEKRTYLNAVVTISKVLHGLELLVDNSDAGLVCPVNDALDILGGLAHGLQLLVQALGSFNSCLRVEFGYTKVSMHTIGEVVISLETYQGKRP